MLKKKKFRLVQENKNMMNVFQNITWSRTLVLIGLISFALLLIFSNFKSENYYKKLKDSKKKVKENSTALRSTHTFERNSVKEPNCKIQNCNVTCDGDVKDVRTYLERQKSCTSIALHITNGIFPDDVLKIDWLDGSFNLSLIRISLSTLRLIEDGAFNKKAISHLTSLELNGIEVQNLTDKSFVGLQSIETFDLVNRIESFSGHGFLKPMMKSLKKLYIKHISSTPTDPGPWLLGESFPKLATIVFEESNFAEFIKAETFKHMKTLSILMMESCKINSIADGTFDFMMDQNMVILISLNNNNLKRLDGEYLSKVGVLKRIIIENNPWDCTCELKNLIKQFKRYPEGFGSDSSCSSPHEYSGNSLSEVNIDQCMDISTLSEMTSTTKIISPTSTSTDPTTPQLSTVDVTQTSSKTTTANRTSDSTTSLQTETDTNFTTVTNSSTTEANEESSNSTTYSTENDSTTESTGTIFLECQRNTARLLRYINTAVYVIELSPPDGNFIITRHSPTSARIIFQYVTSDLSIIWFYEQPSLDDPGDFSRTAGKIDVGCRSELDTTLIVNSLLRNQVYTFCLVKNGSKVTSPFNCQSYYTNNNGQNATDDSLVWLRYKDKPMVIGSIVACIIVAICVGLLGMYLVLRSHPTLLKGSKLVTVLPKCGKNQSVNDSSLENSFSSATTAKQRRYSETSIQSGRSYMMANNYEDIEYRWKMNVVNDMIYANRVPTTPAPPLPKRASGPANQTFEALSKPKIVVPKPNNDYGYIF